MTRSFAVTDVEVFDGVSFHPHQTIVIEDGLISALGQAGETPLPSGMEVIGGEGHTILPGFIDCHVHIELHDPVKVLQGGVTTVRDLGWPAKRIFPLAERLAEDVSAGPRLLAAGPMLTAPGGYPTQAGWAPRGTGVEIESEEGARETVSLLSSAGASVIKVAQEPRQGPVMDEGLLSAVVDAAHSAGLKVTSHLGSLEQLEVALETGVDELAHGLWSDEKIPADILDRMIVQDMVVVPTLHIDPTELRVDNLRRFLAAGGRVIYGTDMGNSGPPPGIDITELELMRRAGMSLTEVLIASTSAAAAYLGLADRGEIRPGARADLVLVEGDLRNGLSPLSGPLLSRRGA
ncbi:MAG TPA: amidohydrolase family protein [Actinomycetota bacterium]|nr:amidohydrolase family protein [Actinomycetota bacterium]